MDNQVMQTEETQGELIQGNFPMSRMPVDAQITIHVNNMIATYGKTVIVQFKDALYNPDQFIHGVAIRRLIEHYGVQTFRNWFTLIYNWQFEKVG